MAYAALFFVVYLVGALVFLALFVFGRRKPIEPRGFDVLPPDKSKPAQG